MRWISEEARAGSYALMFRLLVSAGVSCLLTMPLAGISPAQTVSGRASSYPATLSSAPGANASARNSADSGGVTTPPPAQSTPGAEALKPGGPDFMIVLDAAHGGTDPGALLGADGPEKNYTLALALRLHMLLHERGIQSILTRSGDVALAYDARADIANRARASACILLHATASGNGVHLFTSSLPPASSGPQGTDRAFLPWRTAQASYTTQSLRLESDINAALAHEHVPALLGRTSLMPLDNLACPAVAMEVAPLDAATPLSNPAYQQQIVASLVAALAAWRSDRGQQQ